MNTIKIEAKNVKMIAHRGLSGLERENTCPAFVAAGNRSYWGIETDIHETADGKFVVIHDETTERVSLGNVNIDVEKTDYSEVSGIVLPDLDGSTHRQDIRIPLLEDYLSICKKYEKKCVLELKNPFKKESISNILEIIEKSDCLDNMVFISFDYNNCIILRSLLPDAEIQWLTSEEITDKMIASLVADKLNLDVYYKRLTPNNIQKLHKNDIKVNCWTCDTKEDAEALAEMGVDFITSNILEG